MHAVQRPDPLHWLWFAFGGRLPGRYRDWVMYDATARHWRLRYAVRLVVRTLPFLVAGYVVLNLLPVGQWPIFLALGGALLFVLFTLVGSAEEMTEARLAQHGFPAESRQRVVREHRRR